jgi:hypothetical protein
MRCGHAAAWAGPQEGRGGARRTARKAPERFFGVFRAREVAMTFADIRGTRTRGLASPDGKYLAIRDRRRNATLGWSKISEAIAAGWRLGMVIAPSRADPNAICGTPH